MDDMLSQSLVHLTECDMLTEAFLYLAESVTATVTYFRRSEPHVFLKKILAMSALSS